jgi:hypothetical protein
VKRNAHKAFVEKIQEVKSSNGWVRIHTKPLWRKYRILQYAMDGCDIKCTQNFCGENTGGYNEHWLVENAHKTFVEKIQEITVSIGWVRMHTKLLWRKYKRLQ